MFASLKNKIKEETGSDILSLPVRLSTSNRGFRGRLSSSNSIASTEDFPGNQDQQKDEMISLRNQVVEMQVKNNEFANKLQSLTEEKERLEKTNEILLESVKVAQTQKDIMSEEHGKVQNAQQAEIEKLKSLLSFREQEAVDRLATIKQNQQQIENLTGELERLKMIETMLEDLQDELERLRHSAQLDKNNLTTTLAAVEEENRHLKMRLQIVDQSRLETILTLSSDEKVQALAQERKLLEQRLEEAHLQLSDIKSSWSGQNLALETQVSRLSKQVAEETTEKRKALKARDEAIEKIKQFEFDLQKVNEELEQRNNKIKLLEEEIDELSTVLKNYRTESDEEIMYLQSKVDTSAQEMKDLKVRLQAADDRLNEYIENSEQIIQTLRKQLSTVQEQYDDTSKNLETEKEEKLTALLRNAEISQSEEILKRELRIERDELNELSDKLQELQKELEMKNEEIIKYEEKLTELNTVINSQRDQINQVDHLNNELNEKNKSIKVLNQRLTDLKKTLQQEIKSNNNTMNVNVDPEKIQDSRINNGITDGPIIMDEVNFKYLKHVIVKFLTSREVEARHLIRAVATLLHLSTEEEKLLHDTLNWKMSWFGSKPDHGSGQRAFSIPPS